MNAGRKRYGWRVGVVLCVVVYYLAGILCSGMPQPRVSDAYKESLNTNTFYGEGACCDRATIFEDNEEALFERVRLIHNAKERVILSTFDFRDDEAGKVMIAALLAAAERGVQVRVIVDGVSGMLRMGANPYFMALSTHQNAEIRIYNKINLLKPWALMGRLHDKYVIADDTAYFLGGRNTFSYFLGATDGHINYDRDVFVYNAGGSAESSLYQVEAYFNEVWNQKETKRFHDWSAKARLTSVKNAKAELTELLAAYYTEYPDVLTEPDYAAMTMPTKKITLLANPTTICAKEPTVFYALAELMKQAKAQVTIHTPYLICNEMMYDAFAEIAKQVPKAQLMTNSAANNGNPFGSGDYMAEFSNILRTGMELYEYEGGVSYHAKSIAIDDDLSIVGSFNMDMRSVYLDTELMLVVDSTELNAQLRGIMEQYQAQSGVVAADGSKAYPEGVEPQVMSRKKRMKVGLIYTLLGWARRLM
ncbi:MAG: phospholipase D family protein [Lachnospiraceae bacterium]|nr:phospholipase D family protein [Lachnospiraceae bacterium]